MINVNFSSSDIRKPRKYTLQLNRRVRLSKVKLPGDSTRPFFGMVICDPNSKVVGDLQFGNQEATA